MSTFHDIQVTSLDGSALLLDRFVDQVVLVVNVASQCGLTSQYEGLERLQQRLGPRGFTVLGVPCNQFAGQEPGSEAEIEAFCTTRYGVTFPLTAKSVVNGEARDTLYTLLAGPGATFPGDITWNFEKFLIGRDGRIKARFAPDVTADDNRLLEALDRELSER